MPPSTAPSPSPLRRLFGRWEARDFASLITLAVLVVFFTFAAPGFFRAATLIAVLKQGSVLAIVAVGLTYVMLCGEIDPAVGTIALWSACLCGWLFENWVLSFPGKEPAMWMIAAVILLPLASCLALGLLSGAITIASRLPSFIISLAMMFIADGMAKYLTKGATLEVPGLLMGLGNDGIALRRPYVLPYSALVAGAALVLGHFVLQYTRFGRYVYATGGNRQAARLAGVPTRRIVLSCMAVSGVCAGIGGMINAGRLNNVTLDQNSDLLLKAVAAVVLGGTSLFGGEGSMGKTLIGVLTLTVLGIGLSQINWIDDLARQLLTGIVLIAALVINGLLGRAR